MSDIVEFQKKLLSDGAFRKRFAESPKAVLSEMGIVLPDGVKVPSKIDLKVVENGIDLARDGLDDIGDAIGDIDTSNRREVGRVIEEAFPLRRKDIVAARQAHESILAGGGGDVATVAVVGAVVAAVVAVPVAVFGVESDLALVSNPAVVRVSRGAAGLTLHGPNGIRIEGLSAGEAATIIKSFR